MKGVAELKDHAKRLDFFREKLAKGIGVRGGR